MANLTAINGSAKQAIGEQMLAQQIRTNNLLEV